jgi:Xaa-Pro aminopeptidase
MGPEWDKAFDPWFERFADEPAAQFGTLGFDLMAPVLHDAVRRSLGQRFVLQRADDLAAVPPQRKRPRELTLLRASCTLVQDAAQAFTESWRQKRGEPENAALDAERFARSRAAQDVRTLVSLDGGRTLVPYHGRFDKTAGPLVGYLAVKLMGYWADLFVTVEEDAPSAAWRRVEAALDTLIAAMRPGLRAGELHANAIATLAPLPLHPALGQSVGHGIGLSLNEAPELRAGSDATLAEDGVYTVQLGVAERAAGHVLLSAIVRVRANGAEVLARSPGIAAP